jgi:NAD(P)-dependent dehydrogenase (short-subunit alcohol dehydrogenase family)
LQAHASAPWASATLINNACAIPELVPLRESSNDDLTRALRIGLEAPLLLCSAFLGATARWTVPRKVLNISSGLGRRGMASQSAYCAIKAGMDNFTRCLALEEALVTHGAKVCSLAPGVIATDMQVQLRSADAAHFPDIGAFQAMHDQGQLSTPAQTATRVLAYLQRADFGSNAIGDIRD